MEKQCHKTVAQKEAEEDLGEADKPSNATHTQVQKLSSNLKEAVEDHSETSATTLSGTTASFDDYIASLDSKGTGAGLYGHQMVSKQCAKLSHSSCKKKLGCSWTTVQGENDIPRGTGEKQKCVDAAAWRCTVKKKIVDCVSSTTYSPSQMPWLLDTFCGELMLGQKKTERKLCDAGIRKNEACKKDTHCPQSKDNMKAGRIPKCDSYPNSEKGCQVGVMKNCEPTGMLTLGAMVI
jgi:hypothetical protein